MKENKYSTALPADERLRKLWSSQELWTVDELQTIIKRCQDNGQHELQGTEQATQLLNDFLILIFAFVQNNFTGPFDKLAACTEMLKDLSLEQSVAQEQLKASGEELNPNVKTAQLLLIAKQILKTLSAAQPTSKVSLL